MTRAAKGIARPHHQQTKSHDGDDGSRNGTDSSAVRSAKTHRGHRTLSAECRRRDRDDHVESADPSLALLHCRVVNRPHGGQGLLCCLQGVALSWSCDRTQKAYRSRGPVCQGNRVQRMRIGADGAPRHTEEPTPRPVRAASFSPFNATPSAVRPPTTGRPRVSPIPQRARKLRAGVCLVQAPPPLRSTLHNGPDTAGAPAPQRPVAGTAHVTTADPIGCLQPATSSQWGPAHPRAAPTDHRLECPAMGGDVVAAREDRQFSLSRRVHAAFRSEPARRDT